MARCPKCDKLVPGYKVFMQTRGTGIKCDYCGAKSFISIKSLFSWRIFVSGAIMGTVAIVLNDSLHLSSFFSLLSGFVAGIVFFGIIGWQRITLELDFQPLSRLSRLGGLFLFLGILLFCVFVSFIKTDATKVLLTSTESSKNKMLADLNPLVVNNNQERLQKNGQLDEFNSKFNIFKKEYISKMDKFASRIPNEILKIEFLAFLCSIGFLSAGFCFLTSQQWGRIPAMGAVVLGGLLYIQLLQPIYSTVSILQYVCNGGNDLNLMIDPAYTNFSYCAGNYYIQKMFLSFPYVIVHGFVLFVIIGLLFLLARQKVK